MRCDVLIIGAGPAGSSAARLLAQAGRDVVLVEKAAFPRRKVCGEFISATTRPWLEACGVLDAFDKVAGPVVTRVGVFAAGAMLTAPSERNWGRALGREYLDVMLRDAAMAAGALLLQPSEVVSLSRRDNRHVCGLDDGREVCTRNVIVASGSWNGRGPFTIRHGVAAPADLFAFKAHFRGGQLAPGLMPLLAFPGGYGGLVESDGARISLSCCIRRDALEQARARHGGKAADAVLAHILQATKGARLALGDAALDEGFLATGPIHPGIRRRQEDGVYFTGNIAGEAHPVIAEGISMAIQSSGLLAQLLIAGRGQDYARQWRRRFAPRIHAASVFAHLAMNGAGRLAGLALLRAAPSLLDVGARISGKAAVAV